MQLRIANAHASGPFNSAVPQHLRRHKQQPIFTYQNKEIPPQNIYYDKNPYLLRLSPSQPRMRPILSRSKNQNLSREPSDHSSHRSLKVIRVNGLREAEKPKVIRIQDQHSMHSSRANEQNRRFIHRELELQGENRMLKEQNSALKQMLRKFEQNKQNQVSFLEQKINQLMQITKQLQSKMQKAQTQWKLELKKLEENDINI